MREEARITPTSMGLEQAGDKTNRIAQISFDCETVIAVCVVSGLELPCSCHKRDRAVSLPCSGHVIG